MKAHLRYLLLASFFLLGALFVVQGQDLAFPYNIQIQTVIGHCYDDCQIIITMTDDEGNTIAVNPQTHNAADLATYPLYNIQYFYRNTSDGTALRYDSVNTIQVTNGVYCIGIKAYVPITLSDGSSDFVMVDTSVCDVEVATTYEHLEASVLSMNAKNEWDVSWMEGYDGSGACGFHPAYSCEDRGRIQLQLTKGKFPYYVTIQDENHNIVRQTTFEQPAQSGEYPQFASFRDYYTFDSLAMGNYDIIVSDSCGYTIWLTFEVPNGDIDNFYFQADNYVNSGDSNLLHFYFYYYAQLDLREYDLPYFDSILQYRFINPGNVVSPWYHFENLNGGIMWDTISYMNNYCPVYNDTIYLQVRNLCSDTIWTGSFCFRRNFEFLDLRVESSQFGGTTVPDTCIIQVDSAFSTQTYGRYGDPYGCLWCGYTVSMWDDYTPDIPSRLYTNPISYNVYSAIDSTLLSHTEADEFSWMDSPVTFYTDTVIPVHIVVSDAQGCWLTGYDTVFVFNVSDAGDIVYPWLTGSYYYDNGWAGCCGYDRYFWIQEQGVNYSEFRQNLQMRLIESPLYGKNNFSAVCQDGEWIVTPDNPEDFTLVVEFEEGDGWRAMFRDSVCLLPGRYVFIFTTDCGSDTISYKWTEDPYYYSFHTLYDSIKYETMQVCDRYYVRPEYKDSTFVCHRMLIDADVSNDSIIEEIYPQGYFTRVLDGMAGGYNEYPNSDGYFVFTVPGWYVIRYETYWDNCTSTIYDDTVHYTPTYLDFDRGFALLCDYQSQSGVVLTHAINGSMPYEYYLYNQADMMGEMLATSLDGYFSDVPMQEGQQLSVMVSDSCHNSFYINLTATSMSQNMMAWEFGDNAGMSHCEGDTTFIAALPFSFQADYHWTGPNGFESDSRENSVYLPYGGESGWYVVEILNTGCQTTVTDSVYIEIVQAPRVTLLSEPVVCPGTDAVLAFAVDGYGTVTYDVHHIGDPVSGVGTFTTISGDTLHQSYPIMSQNIFWADHISDERCAYNYLIDTITVSMVSPADFVPITVNTTEDMACFNHAVDLSATANLSYPYYVRWYESPRQAQLLKCDTIWQPGVQSSCRIEHLVSDSTLYVSVSNNENCGGVFGAIYQQVNMQNGSSTIGVGEGVRLFDSGGEGGHYGNNEHYTYTFHSPSEGPLWLQFHSVDLLAGDTLFIYSGNAPQPAALVHAQSQGTFPSELMVNSSNVTFVFHSNNTSYAGGWSVDILSGVTMTAVTAHLAPQVFDTIAATLCPSTTPYTAPGFAPFDISQPIEYLIDTLLLTEDGCQIVTHVDIVVNEMSDTTLSQALMPCQLPYQWNGVTFQDYGTQTATLSNRFDCDSVITMIVSWAPPADSTDVYDTIVENQLPYVTHGLQFTSDGVQVATLTNQDGCDSIITVHLHVFYNVAAEVDSVICDNALPFTWNGVTFTGTDTQTATIPAHTGADSVLTMHLTVNPTSLTVLYDTICQREEYHQFGFDLSSAETSHFGPNTFTCTLTNQFHCDSVVRLELLISPDITPEFIADPDKVLLSEGGYIPFFNQTDLTDLANMNYYWVWDFGDGMSDTTVEYDNNHIYTQWGDYEVTLTLSVNQCVTNVSHMVYVEADLRFPNVITPNGDGINDVFIIENLNPERESKIEIFDRWGREVFRQENYQTYMRDGQVYNAASGFGNDPSLPDGVYYYTFYYQGIVKVVKYHGSITVIR